MDLTELDLCGTCPTGFGISGQRSDQYRDVTLATRTLNEGPPKVRHIAAGLYLNADFEDNIDSIGSLVIDAVCPAPPL